MNVSLDVFICLFCKCSPWDGLANGPLWLADRFHRDFDTV